MASMRFTREENLEFIEINGDKINKIHTDENEAYGLLKRINREYLGKGVIVAGELTKQKVLADSRIKGIPYEIKIGYGNPLVVDKEVYVDYNLEEINLPVGPEPESYHYKFDIKKDGFDIITGEVISHGHVFWSLNGKKPLPLKEPIIGLENIISKEKKIENFYRNEQNGGDILKASSFIPPRMIAPIKDAVNESLGEDSERQYMLSSQHITVYRKKVDLSAPLSFYYTKPIARQRKQGNFCPTKLQINSKNECILECQVLGIAV